jgi:thioredoxin 1
LYISASIFGTLIALNIITQMDNNIKALTDESFNIILEESKFPFIVMFETSWCGTSHLMNRILNQLVSDFKHKIQFFSIDVETNKVVKKRFHVHEIPTLMIIQNGQVVQKIEGIISRKDLEKKINSLIELNSHI